MCKYLLVCLTTTLACLSAPAREAATPLIFVSIPPQKWLLRQLAGTNVNVELLVDAGQSPHNFEPTGRRLAALAGARAWMTIGLPFENLLTDKVRGTRPDLPVFPLHSGIPRIGGHAHTHSSHDASRHPCHDDGSDPHVWLSPAGMSIMATNACRALCALLPEQAPRYRAALDDLTRRLRTLHARLQDRLAPCKGHALWLYHPSWGYFTHAYGLRQVAIEQDGHPPSARHLARLLEQARRERIRTVFHDPQYDPEPLEALTHQIGAGIAVLDPLAEDWEKNMLAAAETIRQAILPATSAPSPE